MAHDTDAPDTAGKDMDMSDLTRECSEPGCTRDAARGKRKCPRHAE
jgi:hypothetical protein